MNDEHLISIIRERSSLLEPIPTKLESGGVLRAPVRAVFFDVYGTLFVSGSGDIEILENSVQDERLGALLTKYGIPPEDAVSVRERYFTRIREVHEERKLAGVDFPEVVIEKIWEDVLGLSTSERSRVFALEYELLFNPVWPMPGLETILQALKSRGLIMGLVSNAQFFTPLLFKAFLERDIDEVGFTRELVLYSYLYGYAKPSSFLFERARSILDTHGFAPEEALYVGNDMLNDVYAAARSGFQTVLFAGDARSLRMREEDPRCREVKPDVTVLDLKQISDFLEASGDNPD